MYGVAGGSDRPEPVAGRGRGPARAAHRGIASGLLPIQDLVWHTFTHQIDATSKKMLGVLHVLLLLLPN